jgi:hypothetical protein
MVQIEMCFKLSYNRCAFLLFSLQLGYFEGLRNGSRKSKRAILGSTCARKNVM